MRLIVFSSVFCAILGAQSPRPFRSLNFADFPSSCTAKKDYLNRLDPALSGQALYRCKSDGTGYEPVLPDGVPQWRKYSLVAIANGVNGCASVNGCWQVNGVLGPSKTATTQQTIVLFQLPANGYLSTAREKLTTSCTGTTSLTQAVGVTGAVGFCGTGYDLKQPVSDTWISSGSCDPGSNTAAATNVTTTLSSDVGHTIDQIATGCSVDVWFLWGVLP